MNPTTPAGEKEELSPLELRFEGLVGEAMNNGFTRNQAAWLINLLNEFIPIV